MRNSTKAKIAIVSLEVLFLGGAWIVGKSLPPLSPLLFYGLLALAAYRGGRAIAFNYVFKWLRDIIGVKEELDSSGAGSNNNAKGEGVQYALGELVTCPICSGTWFGMLLLVMYYVLPPMGLGLIVVLGVAGIAEVIHWLSEYLCWGARASREKSGTAELSKKWRKLQ